jgi:molybdopterin synthase sulfur carrier subunit
MGIMVELPTVLLPYVRGRSLELPSAGCVTVGDALALLSARCPGVVDRMLDELGELRPHVNLFVDDKSIRFTGGLQTPVRPDSTIVVVPAVSGG